MKKRLFTFGLIGLLLAIAPSGFSGKGPPGKYRKIQKYLDQATRDKLAGVVVYIQSPKHGEWIITSGYANLEEKTRLQRDHIFSLASIGKMYNAVAVLKLVEAGRLKLDDKIADYLPVEIVANLPNGTEVTLRHLLRHASGFVNYENDPELVRQYISGQLKLDTLSHLDALRKYVFGKPALFKPGEKYHYSSTNYLLVAMIVDKVLPEGH